MVYNLFDTLMDGVVVLNENEQLVYCNEAFSALAGTPLKRLKPGTKLENYLTFSQRLYKTSEGLKAITDPTPYKEIPFTSKQGRTGRAQISIQPAENNWILFFRDVTLEETLHKKYRSQLDEKERALIRLQKAQDSLKSYSKNLEKKVQERTADLAASNLMLGAMINSLGQGFIVFDEDGICSPVFSRACLKLFETDPSHKPIETVLRIPAEGTENFRKWYKLLFEEAISFEDLAFVGPKKFPHSKKRYVTLEYYPVRDSSQKISKVVVVATDKTDEMAAIEQSEKERIFARSVVNMIKNKDMFWQFVRDTRHVLKKILSTLQGDLNSHVQDVFLLAHTLKGVASIFSMDTLVKHIHDFETFLKEWDNSSLTEKPDKIRQMKEQVHAAQRSVEDFLEEHQYILGGDVYSEDKKVEVSFSELAAFSKKLENNPDLARAFEDYFIKEPIGKFFRQFDHLVSEMARRTQKEIHPMKFIGQDIRIMAQPYEALFKTMAHVIKNAIEHGIETPKERISKGKNPTGTLSIEFSRKSGTINITVRDDGAGIDPQRIRKKLEDLGRSEFSNESDEEIIQHIFDDGFTTRESVDVFSGRGVGMRAVQLAVRDLGGSLRVESQLNVGTTLSITLPEKSESEASVRAA